MSGTVAFQKQVVTMQGAFRPLLNVSSMSPSLKSQGAISAAIGAVLGVAVSLIVNCTLIEISISPFFAFYFGALFISVGAVIIWRVGAVTAYQPLSEDERMRKFQFQYFGYMIIFSGVLCFLLERHWFVGIHYVFKVPLYTVLGISVSFALTFALVDVLNYTIGFMQISFARPIIESPSQVFLVLASSLIMGGVFGLIFGMMDIEDKAEYTIKLALMKEEHFCYPIGLVFGALAGFGNEVLRQQSDEYSALQSTEFDDDI